MKKGIDKALAGICSIALFSSIYSITSALVGNIANSYPDVPYTTVSQIMTLPTLVGLVVSFISGPLAMRFDKKKLILLEQCCVLTAMIVFILIGTKGPLWGLIVCAALVGIATGSHMSFVSSLIGERFGTEKSGTYIALTTSFTQIGLAAANIVAGIIAAGNNGAAWPKAYYLGLLLIPCMLVFWKFVPSDEKKVQVYTAAKTNAAEKNENEKIPFQVVLILISRFLIYAAFSAYMYNYSNYVIREYQLGTSVETGMLATFNMLIGMACGFTYKYWSKLFKEKLVVVSYTLPIIGLVAMMVFTTSMLGVTIAAVMVGMSMSISSASSMAMAMQWTPKRLVPITSACCIGFLNLGAYSGLYLGSYLAGFLGGGMQKQILVGIIFGILAIIVLLTAMIINKKKQPA